MSEVVVDTSVLSSFAQTGHLTLMGRILSETKVVTTTEVLDELRNGTAMIPSLAEALRLDWLHEVFLRGLADLGVFAEYTRRLGSSTGGDVGEATVLAYAERYGAIALLDDKHGRTIAKERGVVFRGSLGLLTMGLARQVLTLDHACQVVDDLRAVGTYLPCTGAEFPGWATDNGLFVPPDAASLTLPSRLRLE